MPLYEGNQVKICGGTIVYEAITQPGQNQAGKTVWELAVVFPPTCQDLPLADQLAQQALAESKFRGVLPNGGNWPLSPVGPDRYNGQFNGWTKINFKTQLKAPDVYDANGQLLQPMQYGPLVFTGQTVDVLTSFYEYDNIQKGIGASLNAFECIVAAGAQPQNFGGAAVNTAGAFGAAASAPVQQPGVQQPAQGLQYQQPPATPAQAAPDAYQQPNTTPPQQPAQQPAQAHNFMPGHPGQPQQ